MLSNRLISSIRRIQLRSTSVLPTRASFSTFKYAKSHEYFDTATNKIGITDFAQSELGDIVFVDLPEVGDEFEAGDEFAGLESVKAAADVYMPVSGKIIAVNEALEGEPELANTSPTDAGWFVQIEMAPEADHSSLLSQEEYNQHIQKK